MRQIRAPEAHAITRGRSSVVVGDIDTGLDWTHPDLAPSVEFSRSVSCVGGVPNQDPAAWMDNSGHGTHTAGTIAAAANGIGIVGVAPNVKIAGIKAATDEGFFFPEAVVCAFMWAPRSRRASIRPPSQSPAPTQQRWRSSTPSRRSRTERRKSARGASSSTPGTATERWTP